MLKAVFLFVQVIEGYDSIAERNYPAFDAGT